MQVNLMLGDCLERMKEIPDGSVDMVFTSPPYNLGISTGGGLKGATKKREVEVSKTCKRLLNLL